MVTKLRMLPARTRFALLAYEFEKWPIRWVRLVMRMRPHQLHGMLASARCELCGVSWESLALEERACLEAISSAMDDSANLRVNQAIHLRTRAFPRVTEIKAEWLELRPMLVEARLRFLPEPAEREAVLAAILNAISGVPMQRPLLVDRVVNSVHFSRHQKNRASYLPNCQRRNDWCAAPAHHTIFIFIHLVFTPLLASHYARGQPLSHHPVTDSPEQPVRRFDLRSDALPCRHARSLCMGAGRLGLHAKRPL